MADLSKLRRGAIVAVRAEFHGHCVGGLAEMEVGSRRTNVSGDQIVGIISQPFQPGDVVRLDDETIGTLISFSAHDRRMAFFEPGTTDGGIQHVEVSRLRHENVEAPQ